VLLCPRCGHPVVPAESPEALVLLASRPELAREGLSRLERVSRTIKVLPLAGGVAIVCLIVAAWAFPSVRDAPWFTWLFFAAGATIVAHPVWLALHLFLSALEADRPRQSAADPSNRSLTLPPGLPSLGSLGPIDAERKRELKRLGKAEVERRSSVLKEAMELANPAPTDSDRWADGYRDGVERERWLKKKLPVLSRAQVERMFVVLPESTPGWVPHPGGYVICTTCGSAAPSLMPWRLFYWASCACGNIRWRCILGWQRGTARDPRAIVSAKLLGRAK
jgi:hypothetical protein